MYVHVDRIGYRNFGPGKENYTQLLLLTKKKQEIGIWTPFLPDLPGLVNQSRLLPSVIELVCRQNTVYTSVSQPMAHYKKKL